MKFEKFDEISEEIYQDFSKAEKLLAFNMPLMQFCMYGCMLLHLLAGRQGGGGLRRRCGAGPVHRRTDQPVHLRHADSHPA